jgi:hypothetical protein
MVEFGEQCAALVGAAVVDHHDFLHPRRRCHAIEEFEDRGLFVVTGHHHGKAAACGVGHG